MNDLQFLPKIGSFIFAVAEKSSVR